MWIPFTKITKSFNPKEILNLKSDLKSRNLYDKDLLTLVHRMLKQNSLAHATM